MKTHRPVINATRPPLKAVQLHRFEVIDQGMVDGETWYVTQVEPKVSRWVREQDKDLWYDYKVGSYQVLDTYDIHESLYTLMSLRWT
jgi:hypothetical protein